MYWETQLSVFLTKSKFPHFSMNPRLNSFFDIYTFVNTKLI